VSTTTVEKAGPMAAQLTAALAGNGKFEDDDPKLVAERIAQQLLSADTLDDLFGTGGTVSGSECVGRTLRINDVILRPSDLDNTEVYALIHAIDADTGATVIVNTSSPRIMAQLCRAKDLGAMADPKKPLVVRVVEVGQAKPGQSAPIGMVLA
jgi:hypothetical protein